ncbi:MAG: hypothetical protein M3Q97_06675 [Bacteroidota bacterium]|nr:hypothetical protein [Bacteroidota bacterium]
MLKKDNIGFGFGLAMLITAASFGLFYLVNAYLLRAAFGKPVLQESTLLIIALGLNLFVLNYFTKRNAYKTSRGILIFSFLCAIYLIYTYFGVELGIREGI